MDEPNGRLIQTLIDARRHHCFPPDIRAGAPELIDKVLALLFPHFAERLDCSAVGVRSEVAVVEAILTRALDTLAPRYPGMAPDLPRRFMEQLPDIYAWLRQDADAIFEADPAARSVDEVILTYPGFQAIAIYRIAHTLHVLGFPLLPRLLTELGHQRTGVDIHPGATIGRRFVIDHGTGVVIGETTLIGNGVKIYQGVTLGALQVQKALADKKRHPTIEDDVVVYANATILGGGTVVGRGSIIAGNAFITQSIPPESVVSRRSEVRHRHGGAEFDELEYHI
ncbi:serine O-acetyltransferase EpsC [Vitiosangium sp. GDMCC 1.1324]|uniref:serine O-acetyltransferase EpsC n=1 Tax=Vitiosangium sp. (strain GDMCC 1.1324) TaxID=2138576 RepID=UPI000D352929|nr:serine O-acetyltransferase EpsC [Vitiosangium sp. GDMCC 1.1324]PTL80610.1 serine acetyltransferase [Vitiosangium sp. GDMCC 1.1324]